LSGLGHLTQKDEGDSIEFDIPVEGNSKTVYYTSYAKGFQITREMAQDDLFGNMNKLPAKLAKSAAIKPDVVFFNTIFNNGFDTTTVGDGLYVFDSSRPQLYTGATSESNMADTPSSLSETSLQAGFESFWALEDEAGMPINIEPDILLIPYQLTWVAEKLRQTGLVVGSANNDINTVNPSNGVVGWRIMVSRFLTDTNAWFLLAKERDCRMYWKDNATFESSDDFYTGNALFKVTMRFNTFAMQWKGMYGNAGA
jgi:phage major head subunit gpT-like protein